MKTSVLMYLLVGVVRINCQHETIEHLDQELQDLHSNLINHAGSDPDLALTTFDTDLFDSVTIATYLYEDGHFPTAADAADYVMGKVEEAFMDVKQYARIHEYIMDVCETGKFPSLISVPSHIVAVKNQVHKDITMMCLDLDIIEPSVLDPDFDDTDFYL